MELVKDNEVYKYKASSAEIKRAQLGAFLIGNSLPTPKLEHMDVEEAIGILAGNIILLEQLGATTDQGVTHIPELRSEAAKTVRSGLEILGLTD
jgi:hypothetical protein